MRIAIGTCVYIEDKEQLPELERFLDSVKDWYPVIIVNGKWKDYRGKSGRSIPEVSELIQSYSNTIEVDYPNHLESQARNQYMIIAAKMDCEAVLIIDTDEYLEGDRGVFLNNLQKTMLKEPDKLAFKITLNSERSGGDHWPPRLILNPMFCRYRDRHNSIFFNNNDVFRNQGSVIRGLKLYEKKDFRTKQREETMKERNRANPRH